MCCCRRRKEALALSSHREAVLPAEPDGVLSPTQCGAGRGSTPISHDISSASIQGTPLAAVRSLSRGRPSKLPIPPSTTPEPWVRPDAPPASCGCRLLRGAGACWQCDFSFLAGASEGVGERVILDTSRWACCAPPPPAGAFPLLSVQVSSTEPGQVGTGVQTPGMLGGGW